MKKALSFVLILLTVLLVFISCGSDVIVDPKKTPLTLEFINNCELKIAYSSEYGDADIYYSLNDETEKHVLEDNTPISFKAGDKVSLFRSLESAKPENQNAIISCSEDFYAYGNVMSLIDSTNYATKTDLVEGAFENLFQNSCVKNHSSIDLVLPATKMAEDCYHQMFDGCVKLTKAPTLPATVLADNCYGYMFSGCTSLTTVQNSLPAPTLAKYCYQGMFAGCTSLTKAPELPAEILTDWCYRSMFYNCSSLKEIKCLAIDKSADNCLKNWVKGVAEFGDFFKSKNSTWNYGDSGIPTDWEVHVIL